MIHSGCPTSPWLDTRSGYLILCYIHFFFFVFSSSFILTLNDSFSAVGPLDVNTVHIYRHDAMHCFIVIFWCFSDSCYGDMALHGCQNPPRETVCACASDLRALHKSVIRWYTTKGVRCNSPAMVGRCKCSRDSKGAHPRSIRLSGPEPTATMILLDPAGPGALSSVAVME